MGIFDSFKKNKNIENDNGLNIIYSNNGRGHLDEIFEKENGLKHGLLHHFTVGNNELIGKPVETLYYSQAWRCGKPGGKIFTGDYLPGLPKPLDLHIFSFEEEKKKLMKLHSENYPSIKDKEGVPFSVAKAQKQKSLEKTHKKKSKGYVHGKSTQTYNPGPDAVFLSPIPKKPEIEQEFYANGKLKNEATYKSGKQNGSEKGYHENGQLHYECEWIDGLQDGEITSYDIDGNKIKQSFLKKGSYEGIQREWWPNGKLRAVRIMKNHEVVSEETYNQDGSIVVHEDKIEDLQTVEQLHHDNDTGLRVSITDLQQWKKRFYYNDNLFEGIGFELYENGKLKCELTYVEGQVNGICKEWFESGKIKNEGQKRRTSIHPDNPFVVIEEINGKFIQWYESGQIEKEELWENWEPKLIKKFRETGEKYSTNDGIKYETLYLSQKTHQISQTIDKDKYSTFGWDLNGSLALGSNKHLLTKRWYENGQQESQRTIYEFNNKYTLVEEWYENGQRATVQLLENNVIIEFELEWDESGKLVKRDQSDSIKKEDYEKLIISLGNIDLQEIVKERQKTKGENIKLKIEELAIETTLEDFVNDWELDMNEVEEELNDGYYSDEEVMIDKGEDNCLNVDIISNSFEIIDIINSIYNDQFLMVVKDVWDGETDECETCDGCGENDKEEECVDCEGTGGCVDVEYTSFTLEGDNPDNIVDIVFKGGEYVEKIMLTKKQIEEFNKLKYDGLIDYTNNLKYQEFLFVKKKNLKKDGWEKTLKSFSLSDWDKYPWMVN